MGKDKCRLLLGKTTFLDRVRQAARDADLPVHIISEDDVERCGPLGGVCTAFRRFRFRSALFLSCDMPLVTPELLREMARAHAESGAPLFAQSGSMPGFPFILRRNAEKIVESQIQKADFAIRNLKEAVGGELFAAGDSAALFNVNTPADYRKAQALWDERHGSSAVLEVRNLTIRRDRTQMVSGFSWKVEPGEHWVILGANGCGKTSLFSALLGYLTPTRGDVFVLGEEYGNSDWPELRKRIGLVSSSVRQMMPEEEPAWITVASGKYAMIDYWGTPKARDRSEALRILREIEAIHLADRPWAVLSQGERQRVLIGRALMSNPTLLILDEPCAGLDPAAREQFLDFLDRLGRRTDAPSLVLVTHHVEEIMPVFTHALIMRAGGKLAEGTVRETLTSKNLSEAFGTEIKLRRSGGRYALRVRTNPRLII